MPPAKRRYLKPGEVAELLMVTPMTIRRWAGLGMLPAKTTSGGHRRFLKRDVERFARERGIPLAPRDGDGLRILVIDDNEPFARFVEQVLATKPGVEQVKVAFSGFEAGVLLRDFSPDVILLDLMMPGMSGFEVCRDIKSHPATRDVRVFVVTGYPSRQNVERAVSAGAEGCLSKPLNVGQLLPLLRLS